MISTLPVLMALSWVPVLHQPERATTPAPAPQQANQPAQAANTIQCPITGQSIPSCCCPIKK